MINYNTWLAGQKEEAIWWAGYASKEEFETEQLNWHKYVIDKFELKDTKNDIIVDIGSGFLSALSLIEAKEKIVVDPLNVDNRDTTIKRIKTAAEFILLDNEYVDKVIMYNVLQHVLSPENILNEIARILKVGGKAHIIEQLHANVDGMHHHSLKYQMFEDWIKRHNLKIIKKEIQTDFSLNFTAVKDVDLMCLIVEK